MRTPIMVSPIVHKRCRHTGSLANAGRQPNGEPKQDTFDGLHTHCRPRRARQPQPHNSRRALHADPTLGNALRQLAVLEDQEQ